MTANPFLSHTPHLALTQISGANFFESNLETQITRSRDRHMFESYGSNSLTSEMGGQQQMNSGLYIYICRYRMV